MNPDQRGGLDAATLARPATIVRNGGHVLDQFDRHASGLQGSDGAFATGARALDANFNFLDTEFSCLFGRLLRGDLAGKGSAFTTPLEATRPRTGPAQRITLGVGNSHRGVVERGADVRYGHGNIATRLTTFNFRHLKTSSAKKTMNVSYAPTHKCLGISSNRG